MSELNQLLACFGGKKNTGLPWETQFHYHHPSNQISRGDDLLQLPHTDPLLYTI